MIRAPSIEAQRPASVRAQTPDRKPTLPSERPDSQEGSPDSTSTQGHSQSRWQHELNAKDLRATEFDAGVPGVASTIAPARTRVQVKTANPTSRACGDNDPVHGHGELLDRICPTETRRHPRPHLKLLAGTVSKPSLLCARVKFPATP